MARWPITVSKKVHRCVSTTSLRRAHSGGGLLAGDRPRLSGCRSSPSALSGLRGARPGRLPAPRRHRGRRAGHHLWNGAWIAALAVGVLVWGLIIWCVVAYRRKKDDTDAAGAAALQRADRDPLHDRPGLHDRRALLLHRPRRGRPCSTPPSTPTSSSTSSASSGAGTSTTSTSRPTRAARRPSSPASPAPRRPPDAVPAGRQAHRVRAHLARRHPLVLGAGVPAEARHDPGPGQQVPGRPDRGPALQGQVRRAVRRLPLADAVQRQGRRPGRLRRAHRRPQGRRATPASSTTASTARRSWTRTRHLIPSAGS